jgi:hypothetical protein
MSRSFLNNINKYILPDLIENINKHTNPYILVGSNILFFGTHAFYTYGTVQNKIIVIKKKYKFSRNGLTEFMIIDNNNKHYNVNNSFWFWKWDSVEDWNNLETNQQLIIKYYGYRIPVLGIFPNIITSKQDKLLDSMTTPDYIRLESEFNSKLT